MISLQKQNLGVITGLRKNNKDGTKSKQRLEGEPEANDMRNAGLCTDKILLNDLFTESRFLQLPLLRVVFSVSFTFACFSTIFSYLFLSKYKKLWS